MRTAAVTGLLASAIAVAQPLPPPESAAPRDLAGRGEVEEERLLTRIPPLTDPALHAYLAGLLARLTSGPGPAPEGDRRVLPAPGGVAQAPAGWQAAEPQPTRPGHPQRRCHRPLDQTRPLEAAPGAGRDEPADGIGLMARAGQHTGYARLGCAVWEHPLHAAVINAAGCPVLGIARDEADHSIWHPM